LDALRAKDAEAVVAHQAPSFVQYSLAPPLRSDAANAAGLNAWFDTWDGAMRYELRDLEVVVDGTVAFCHGMLRMSGTKVDGERPDLWFRLTLCPCKLAGAWKIMHLHESVPFYMDGSYRAAVDLVP